MFKAGEVAGIKARRTQTKGLKVTLVLSTEPNGMVQTSEGLFNENELYVTDPTAMATAEARDQDKENYLQELLASVKKHDGPSHKLREKVEKALKKAKVDFNGHWKSGEDINEDYLKSLMGMLYLNMDALTLSDAQDLVVAIDARKALDRWVPIQILEFRSSLRVCSACGKKNIPLETNGKVILFTGEPCSYPKGLPHTEWELNIPSGKLVVANDLRNLFPTGEDRFDVNTTLGCRQTALAYAEVGLAHAFVGNTSPGVYKLKNGHYKLASEPSDSRWNPKTQKYVRVKKPKFSGTRVASICTDLWWFSICDHDEFERRCKHFKLDDSSHTEVVEVPPGVYKFSHDEYAVRDDREAEVIYTTFQKVRDPDPVNDFLEAHILADVNAHAYVQKQTKQWPTLFGKTDNHDEVGTRWEKMTEEERVASWKSVANHTLFTNGNGVRWHEKGFPNIKPDLTIPDVDPPSFRQQNGWYPFSKGFCAALDHNLSPSFAKLTFRILESVISFGMKVYDTEHNREVNGTRERMLLAVTRYRELVKLHPEQADPEYVTWLSEEGRAEAWVENFDLGPEFTEKHLEYVRNQRWVPEDTYAIEFDASKLKHGEHFAGEHGWAQKEGAKKYAILGADNGGFWSTHAIRTAVPLRSVARVVKVGEVSPQGETLVELAYDYGTPWMQDATERKAIPEAKLKEGIRLLTEDEYKVLLGQV